MCGFKKSRLFDESCHYFLVLISIGFRLQKAAHVRTMSSAWWIIVIGRVDLRIRYVFILLMALSTCIRRFATFLVLSHSADVICAFTWASTWRHSEFAKPKHQLFSNLESSIGHDFISSIHGCFKDELKSAHALEKPFAFLRHNGLRVAKHNTLAIHPIYIYYGICLISADLQFRIDSSRNLPSSKRFSRCWLVRMGKTMVE